MRALVTLAILIVTAGAARAESNGPVIAIPGRAGVPVIINGVDASYAVVEGDWGLDKGIHRQPTVYGGHPIEPMPPVGHYYPSAGHMPGYGRLEIESAEPAEACTELLSILVSRIQAGRSPDPEPKPGAGISAAGDRGAANQRTSSRAPLPAKLSDPATERGATEPCVSSAERPGPSAGSQRAGRAATSSVIQAQERNDLTGECNA